MKNIIICLDLDEQESSTAFDSIITVLGSQYEISHIDDMIFKISTKNTSVNTVTEPDTEQNCPVDGECEPQDMFTAPELSQDDTFSAVPSTALEIEVYINSLGISITAEIVSSESDNYDAELFCDFENGVPSDSAFITVSTCSSNPIRIAPGICSMYMSVDEICKPIRVRLTQRTENSDFKLLINNSYLSNNMHHDQISTQ